METSLCLTKGLNQFTPNFSRAICNSSALTATSQSTKKEELFLDRNYQELTYEQLQKTALGIIDSSSSILTPSKFDLEVRSIYEITQAKINPLIVYLDQKETPQTTKEISETKTALLALPKLLKTFLTTTSIYVIKDFLTDNFISLIKDLFLTHDFGNSNEPIDLINKKAIGFKNTLNHLIAVNKARESLASLNPENPITQFYTSQMPKIDLAVYSLLDIFHTFHDFGKFGPPKNPDNTNNYGVHPAHGYQLLTAFMSQGESIFDYSKLPPYITKFFTLADLNRMVIGLQTGHLVLAGPALGENSKLTWFEFCKEPVLQPIFQDSFKRQLFLRSLALITLSDVASYGFLTDEKVSFYLGSVNELENLIKHNLSTPLKIDFRAMNAEGLLGSMYPELPADQIPTKHFEERFAMILSANTPNRSQERTPGFLIQRFNEFLNQNYEPKKTIEIKKKLIDFFKSSYKLEYFRHFFQLLLLDKTQYLNPNDYYKNFKGFDQQGFEFFLAFVDHLNSKKTELGIGPNSLITIRTGTINAQGYNKTSMSFYENIVKDRNNWPRFFATFNAKANPNGIYNFNYNYI
ncbi:MAG: hypothetical protein WC860_07770 [Candidatus Margulisiibacteriota bacterium]|jgi:hypothetical protein